MSGMAQQRSSFVGYCAAKTDASAGARSHQRFSRLLGRAPRATYETSSWVLQLDHAPSMAVGSDPSTGLVVVVHGEVLGMGSDGADGVARLLAGDEAAAAALQGSFALVVVDPARDRIAVVTDRVNARRVYRSVDQEGTWLSTTLAEQPPGLPADPVGVGWMLSNGAVHASRTVLAGVSVLERSSWNIVTSSGMQASPYWRFELGATGDGDEQRLSAELGDLLVGAVERHVADDPDLFVSLSGGFDATAIIGALALDLGVLGARCFSYSLGGSRSDADERRAAQAAALAGYRHELIPSYSGDFISAIGANARLGEGMKNFVHEVDAWLALAPRFAELRHPVVLAGDECFGGALDHTITTTSDVLNSAGIRSSDTLRRLVPHLEPDVAEAVRTGIGNDTAAILRRGAAMTDLRDLKDFLYLDQRLANVIGPWREGFAMPFATLRNPLLDNDILDLVARMPRELRRTKILFRRTVTRRYPQLFALPRAKRSNYMVDLAGELVRHRDQVRKMATDGNSRLDEVVPPSVTLALLAEVDASASSRPTAKARGRDLLRSALPPRASNVVRRHRPPARPGPVDAATLVVRLLILRRALERA